MRLLVSATIVVGCWVPQQAMSAPNMLGYSGQLTDSANTSLTADYDFQFRLFTASSGGTPIFSESIDNVPVADGYFYVVLSNNELGGGQSLSEIMFLHSELYLELEVDGETLAPRQLLSSVPWALGSGVAWEQIEGIPANLSSLGSLSCPAGHIAQSTGPGLWACIPFSPEIDAADIVSGTISFERLPVGTTASTVAAGNHTHAASHITSGTLNINRIPTGTSGTTVALGNHSHLYRVRRVDGADTVTALCSGLTNYPTATGGGCHIPGSTIKGSYPLNSSSDMSTNNSVPVGWRCICSYFDSNTDCSTVRAFAVCAR